MPFVFTHQGGAPGVIEDIVIRLDRLDGDFAALLVPIAFLDERAYVAAAGAQNSNWTQTLFHPIALAKGSQVERFIQFTTDSTYPNFPGGNLSPGRYALTILMKTSAGKDYVEFERRVDDFSAAFVEALGQRKPYAIQPPSPVELRRKIRR